MPVLQFKGKKKVKNSMRKTKRKSDSYQLNSTDISFRSLMSNTLGENMYSPDRKNSLNQSFSLTRKNRTFVSKKIERISENEKVEIISMSYLIFNSN